MARSEASRLTRSTGTIRLVRWLLPGPVDCSSRLLQNWAHESAGPESLCQAMVSRVWSGDGSGENLGCRTAETLYAAGHARVVLPILEMTIPAMFTSLWMLHEDQLFVLATH